ncbi:hypothetical protein [Streptosporangium saharense]|uniref:hypothetical protein n=1 Tax=Streptosporangium saharense TaxID=1706840 RepID=UPI00331C300D
MIGRRDPQEYFAEAEEKHPGVLASQRIPADPDLWRVERYPDFLAARRELLAQAVQSFLTELRNGTSAAVPAGLRPVAVVTGRALAVAEAFWPDGLQTGQGKPVVLELDPDVADLPRLEELGYEVFTPVEVEVARHRLGQFGYHADR